MNLNDEFAKEELYIPQDADISRIGTLAQRQVDLEQEIDDLNCKLSERQKELDQVRDKDLPDLLLGVGLTELKLKNGEKISVDKMVFASIKGENKESCLSWLDENGFGSIIKYKLEVDAGKGGTEQINRIIELAKQLGIKAESKNDVHPSTLKAFVKEQLDKVSNFPVDLFSVHIINRTKIK
jgi:hypothetical protein